MTTFDERVDCIAVLPDDLANQIAAGEVVERPASVVKELAENAIDAGALRVDIEIASGGVALCRVRDDGSGMSERDAKLALTRHATSKITSFDDLTRIGSFGFRGEALPSIASVSRLRVETRRRGDDRGTSIFVEGGGDPRVEPCGAPIGTMVEVRDLFFNVPARRKFLRALPTESAHVTEVVESIALSHAAVTFTLTRDGRRVREYLRASDNEARARDVFAAEDLVRCAGSRGPLRVEAFLSRPDRARAGAGSLALFVNHRPVRDRALARAVAQAYGGVLEAGRFPMGAVFIEIPLESVDVNVHPQKSEVRFADGRAVADALFRVLEGELARALGTTRGQRSTGRGQERPWATPATWGSAAPSIESVSWVGSGSDVDHQGTQNVARSNSPTASHGHLPLARHAGRIEEPGLDLAASSTSDEGFAGLRFVTQLRGAYLLCESLDAVVIIDRHGALEVVAFDRYKRQVRDKFVARRPLPVPVVVRLGARQVALVEEAHDDAAMLGFDVRSSGRDSVSMHAIPELLGDADVEALANDLVAELSGRRDPSDQSGIDRVLATMACRGSIRAGAPFSDDQASSLVVALAGVEVKGPCPHGRPVLTRVSYRELSQRAGPR